MSRLQLDPGFAAILRARVAGALLALSLYWRVLVVNVAVVVAAAVLLAVTPLTISSSIDAGQAVFLSVGVVVVVVVNALLLKRSFAPLRDLTVLMGRIDLLRPGQRLPATGGGEVREVIATFNEMLERLEGERRRSARRVLMAQERERRRISRELHDEIGQSLTALLLQLRRALDQAGPEAEETLLQAQTTARATLDEVGRIAWQLRPGVLDDLGLARGIEALTFAFSERTGIEVESRLDGVLPALSAEGELAVYRIAQESLTNVAKHADARRVSVDLRAAPGLGGVVLEVSDDGRGATGEEPERSGMSGMRERAILANADLTIESAPDRGVNVILRVPGEHL